MGRWHSFRVTGSGQRGRRWRRSGRWRRSNSAAACWLMKLQLGGGRGLPQHMMSQADAKTFQVQIEVGLLQQQLAAGLVLERAAVMARGRVGLRDRRQ